MPDARCLLSDRLLLTVDTSRQQITGQPNTEKQDQPPGATRPPAQT